MMGRARAKHPPTIPPEPNKVRPALLSQGVEMAGKVPLSDRSIPVRQDDTHLHPRD